LTIKQDVIPAMPPNTIFTNKEVDLFYVQNQTTSTPPQLLGKGIIRR